MMNVLIADDEAMARIMLKNLLDWEAEGCRICGEAENGPDALRMITDIRPDILFTDMSMPGMNGVELIRAARQVAPEMHVVAFSGFDDFQYVRQSMKEGALDYLVKHSLDAETLRSLLTTVRENIRSRDAEAQRLDRMMELASSGKALLQRNVLRNLINGYVPEDMDAVLKAYDLPVNAKNLMVIASRIDEYHQFRSACPDTEYTMVHESMLRIIQNLCTEYGQAVCVPQEDGRFILILSFGNLAGEAQMAAQAVDFTCRVEGAVRTFLNIPMSFGISGLCPHIRRIRDFTRDAVQVLENGYFKGGNYIIRQNELDAGLPAPAGLSVADEKALASAVRSLNTMECVDRIAAVFDALKQGKTRFEAIRMTGIDLINLMGRLEMEMGMPETGKARTDLYQELQRFETPERMKLWFTELFRAMMAPREALELHDRYSPVVRRAVSFILAHYQSNISLSDVAEQVDVSPQYLSKLFKEECGRGFVAYLNHVRIERAKQLLLPGTDLKELSRKLGFNNYTYFFTVFKENTGMTPQQYEKQQAGA